MRRQHEASPDTANCAAINHIHYDWNEKYETDFVYLYYHCTYDLWVRYSQELHSISLFH